MEKTTKINYSIIRTRNSEFDRYKSNMKSLYVRLPKGALIWKGQNENARKLEKIATQYATLIGSDVEFELRTGFGVRVEYGSILQSKQELVVDDVYTDTDSVYCICKYN